MTYKELCVVWAEATDVSNGERKELLPYGSWGLGGAMVQSSCSNGHVIYKDMGLSLIYDQGSFFYVLKLSNHQ